MLTTAEAAGPEPGNVMSVWRIALLMTLSYGLYFPYWMYRTWRQYSRHTGHRGYPVWHGLAWLVPVYGFFRFHAHGTAYRRLLDERNLPHDISMSEYIVALIIAAVIGSAGSILLATTADTPPPPLAYALLGAAITMETGAIILLQRNLNRYWQHAGDGLARNARLGKGEILIAAIGIIFWAAHFASAGVAT